MYPVQGLEGRGRDLCGLNLCLYTTRNAKRYCVLLKSEYSLRVLRMKCSFKDQEVVMLYALNPQRSRLEQENPQQP